MVDPDETTARRFSRPVERFVRWESSSAVLLIGAAVAALVWANASDSYANLWDAHASFQVGPLHLDESLRHWVNDLLMAVFFFVVALEVKREMLFGSLSDRRSALVPAAAAFGTMIGAAAVYLAVNAVGDGDLEGWAIPIATDIAFALGVLGLAGRRAPKELRAFMLTLAVVDDLGTILVIAVFFTDELSFWWLGASVILVLLFVLARWAGVRNMVFYVLLAAAVWLAVFESGVHATVAGVVLGLLTPAVADRNRDDTAADISDDLVEILEDDREINDAALMHTAHQASRGVSPLARVEEALHPYSAYLILPLFALANAGVPVSVSGFGDAMSDPVGLGHLPGARRGRPDRRHAARLRFGPGRTRSDAGEPGLARDRGSRPAEGDRLHHRHLHHYPGVRGSGSSGHRDPGRPGCLAGLCAHRSGRHLHTARTPHPGDRKPLR